MNVLGITPSKDAGQTLTVTTMPRTLMEMGATIADSATNWAILVPDGAAIRVSLNPNSPTLSATVGLPCPDGLFIFMNRGDWQTAKFWAASNTRLQVAYATRWGAPQGLSV